MAQPQFYLVCRQINPRPAGAWVLKGPYDTYAIAEEKRDSGQALDMEFSLPLSFATSDLAEAHVDRWNELERRT